MTGLKFDCDAYLERISVDSSITMSEDYLEQIHRAQAYTIPFENFDILLGRGIDLSPEKLFQKMVMQPRGGYCFELNGLFLFVLQSFGFKAIPLLARVHLRGEPTGRHHQLILVTIKGNEWIADVGFGSNGLRAPIPFKTGQINEQDGLAFRLIEYPPFGTMLQVMEQEQWQNLYSFDMEHVCQADIDSGNHFTSTSPKSLFTWARVATLPNETGRVSLMDFSLTVVSSDSVDVIELVPGVSYLDAVKEYFGIIIDEPYESLKPSNQEGIG